MGDGTGDGMGRTSLGCLLVKEAAAEKAEEENMVPLQQPCSALSVSANSQQREAIPKRVYAGEACQAVLGVSGSLGCLSRAGVTDHCFFAS